MSVSAEMMESIRAELADLETTEGCRVLFAVESGSRAWGFPSADSDYDIRFVYVRPLAWYLSIRPETRRDTINRPILGEIDLAGWDLRKALGLFAKSNPPLLEWLDSPIVYLNRLEFAERLRGLMPTYFQPRSLSNHYRSMARGNFRDYLLGDRVRPKKYFYVIRPMLAARWVDRGLGPVPMELERLLEPLADEDPAFVRATRELIGRKRSGHELEDGLRIDPIHDFLVAELVRMESAGEPELLPAADLGPLDALMSEYLKRAWAPSS